MDFIDFTEYCYNNIIQLIDNEVEESIHLDYKAAGSIAKDDKKRIEITKDVSAFANSDGGIIVYGLCEKNHKPFELSFIDGSIFTKEWLESIINNIQPKIDNVRIFPIRKDGDLSKTIYVVKIPRSDDAPHMARDKRYYKRFNFSSEPMENYEVKDLMNRKHYPKLQIIGCSFQKEDGKNISSDAVYSFRAWIKNIGKTLCKEYKLSASFFNLPKVLTCSYQPAEGKVLSMEICDYCFRLSSPSKEVIFPNEYIETGHYQFIIPIDQECMLKNVYIKLTLRYEDKGFDELLTDIKNPKEVCFYESKEIEDYIHKDHPDFNLIYI